MLNTLPVITDEQIVALNIPLAKMYSLVEEGFRLHGLGLVENPPKQGLHPRPRAFMHAMPAFLKTLNIAGTKLVSVFPDNVQKGVPATTGVIVMMDPETGLSTAFIDATWITNVRTAMVSMVTTKYLHAGEEPVFGIVGATGASGRAHLDAIAEVFPNSRVLVNSRSLENCTRLAEQYEQIFGDRLQIVMDQEALTRQSDVLVVATSKLAEPIFKREWLRPGANVLNVHALGWPRDIYKHVDLVSCDDWAQISDPTNGVTLQYVGMESDFELGEVVCGRHEGRESDDQIIFSFNYGLAIFDVLLGDYVLKAFEQN